MTRLLVLAGLIVIAAAPLPAAGPSLSVSGTTLQLDGRPAFVLGASLFDALGPIAPRDQDLDALKSWGVTIVRVWAHWHEPIYGADGALTAGGPGASACPRSHGSARAVWSSSWFCCVRVSFPVSRTPCSRRRRRAFARSIPSPRRFETRAMSCSISTTSTIIPTVPSAMRSCA